jgi:hypothetical protein
MLALAVISVIERFTGFLALQPLEHMIVMSAMGDDYNSSRDRLLRRIRTRGTLYQ